MHLTLPIAVVLGLIVMTLIIRLSAGGSDRLRIQGYISSMGGRLVECRWAPLGPGWFGERSSRIYEIVYLDSEAHIHRAHVKTSALSGVYLTNDCIIDPPSPVPAQESLEEEKARLRRRLAELEARDP